MGHDSHGAATGCNTNIESIFIVIRCANTERRRVSDGRQQNMHCAVDKLMMRQQAMGKREPDEPVPGSMRR
jgi:hypothetical protein